MCKTHDAIPNPGFNLDGMEKGDFFYGCESCLEQYQKNAICVKQCRNCLGDVKEFRLTQEDVDLWAMRVN